MEIITKVCTKCGEEKELEHFAKAKSGKFGRKAECKSCQSQRFKKFYNENVEEQRQRSKDYIEKNAELVKQRNKEFYHANKDRLNAARKIARDKEYSEEKDKILTRNKAWRENNKDKVRETQKKYNEQNREKLRLVKDAWNKKNADKIAAWQSHHRAMKRKATPPWLTDSDKEITRAFYTERNRLNVETGIKHQVDHIIPLTHPLVCGLHVPWNLQILTAKENISKSNKFEIE